MVAIPRQATGRVAANEKTRQGLKPKGVAQATPQAFGRSERENPTGIETIRPSMSVYLRMWRRSERENPTGIETIKCGVTDLDIDQSQRTRKPDRD